MVYLVDDDADDLEIIQAALLQNQFFGPVRTATNGKILMDALRDKQDIPKPDVIILDLNMPLKDGFQVLEEMKRNRDLSKIPVVVLTSSKNSGDEIRCLELGCNFFFNKPYRLNDYEPIAQVVKKFAEHS